MRSDTKRAVAKNWNIGSSMQREEKILYFDSDKELEQAGFVSIGISLLSKIVP